ncbi:hypothetical protein ACFY3G_44070 [Streptomyces phaeochromogenes]
MTEEHFAAEQSDGRVIGHVGFEQSAAASPRRSPPG